MAHPRLGMHLLSKAGNQFFGNPSAERDLQIDVLRRMGITDLKLVTDSDSQLEAARYLVQQGFGVIVRFYRPPPTLDNVPSDQIKMFKDVGVEAVESYVNEPEIEWGVPPTAEWIDALAQAYIKFADSCGREGITPITPAIQGDRVYNWFEPFIATVVRKGRKDALEGSIIGCHPRPANNLPDTKPPGFVALSYEFFDDVVRRHVGRRLRIRATEWGYEPGDKNNAELPRIDYQSHAAHNVRLAQMAHRECLEVVYYWTWLHDWFDSGWWRSDVDHSLPVVKAFIDMQKPVIEPEPPMPEPVMTDDQIRNIAWNKLAVPWNPAAALYQYAKAHGLGRPLTAEWDDGINRLQIYDGGIVVCPINQWDKVRHVPWL